MKQLRQFFEFKVDVTRKQIGKHPMIEALISEESLLLGKYLWNEFESWIPRLYK